jgi:hypothetical protein
MGALDDARSFRPEAGVPARPLSVPVLTGRTAREQAAASVPVPEEDAWVIVHTHWDREWYMPFERFRGLLVQLMDNLVPMLEADPQFRSFHLDGQVAPIVDYLEFRPEMAPRVEALVRAGRLQIGPFYTLHDQFLVSGETSMRNLDLGLRTARSLGGGVPIGYFPDQFGGMAQMPQVLALRGIDRAVVSRGVPPSVVDQHIGWRGLDGTLIDTLYLSRGYDSTRLVNDPANGRREVRAIRAQRPGEPVLVMNGYDHDMPDRLLPRRVARLGGAIVTLEEFMNALPAAGTTVLDGELRSVNERRNLTPGVVSNRVDIRFMTARAERELERYAEPLAAFILSERYPVRPFEKAWRNLVENAAHDSVTCTGQDSTSLAVKNRAQETYDIAGAWTRIALGKLGERMSEGGRYVWNPSNFTRTFQVPSAKPDQVMRAIEVPPLGWARVEERHLANPQLNFPLKQGALWELPELRVMDEPDRGDTYNFGRDSSVAPARIDIPLHVEQRPDEAFTRVQARWVNETRNHRTRLHIKLPAPVDTVTADTGFGAITRPAVPDPYQGSDRLDGYPAGRYILAGGLAIMVDRVAEFQYLPEAHEIAITLLRAHGALSRPDVEGRPNAPGPLYPTHDTQLLGPQEWNLAIMPWDASNGLPQREWEEFALPAAEFTSRGGGDLPPRGTAYPDVAQDQILSAVLPDVVRTYDAGPPWKIHEYTVGPELPRRARRRA